MAIRIKVKKAKVAPAAVAPVDDFSMDDFNVDDFDDDFADFGDDMSFDEGFVFDDSATSNLTAHEMAARFPTVPLDICHRAIKACEISGVPSSYYVDRYCLHLHTATPLNNNFSEAYMELMKNDRA